MSVKIKQKNPGWLDRVLRDRKKAERRVAIGFPAEKAKGIRYPDSGERVIDVAMANNFGTEDGRIPRRDFMTPGGLDAVKKTAALRKKIVVAADQGEAQKVNQLYEQAGNVAAGALKKTIRDLRTPPNAPETIARKGSSNPLIDTSLMVKSVTYDVRKTKT